jgi:hypothetical protein
VDLSTEVGKLQWNGCNSRIIDTENQMRKGGSLAMLNGD